jgi:hypothetical protein
MLECPANIIKNEKLLRSSSSSDKHRLLVLGLHIVITVITVVIALTLNGLAR